MAAKLGVTPVRMPAGTPTACELPVAPTARPAPPSAERPRGSACTTIAAPSAPPPLEGSATRRVVEMEKGRLTLRGAGAHSAPTCVACPAPMLCVRMPHAAALPSAEKLEKGVPAGQLSGPCDSVAFVSACVHAEPPVPAVTPHHSASAPAALGSTAFAAGFTVAEREATVLVEKTALPFTATLAERLQVQGS
jgi:hypothetical protein